MHLLRVRHQWGKKRRRHGLRESLLQRRGKPAFLLVKIRKTIDKIIFKFILPASFTASLRRPAVNGAQSAQATYWRKI
ncbi:MAG: hypothetical protein A2Z43_03200 [Syntrophobacterales bacterium RBG_19FT_COMBO_59_10]|nr:MAG: hypothetical protein A2Z43_03200 [Syntrophobacterales bacterium RBG_19FT_COMBO_59_10]